LPLQFDFVNQLRFNPRAHAGRDALQDAESLPRLVSIHAPTRGATKFMPGILDERMFQSTRPRGARQPVSIVARPVAGFNPRAHAGRDPLAGAATHSLRSFNPRAHAGRDAETPARLIVTSSFQSTRPRGARRRSLYSLRPYCGFQSTRPRGARHAGHEFALNARQVSIHAPTRGATILDERFNQALIVSIHAPTRGAT